MSENLFPREDWEGENEFLEYMQFLFLETPSQETAVARSPFWHCDSSVAFLPSWNPNTECWEASICQVSLPSISTVCSHVSLLLREDGWVGCSSLGDSG